ncbi:helix-turn-helix transcriptional regulator [Brevibacillus ruminantium]|uniref:Helix-turn-helix transcriptional regulator n=1 Tax=Brevibacillus ruminantium TaxID=2950604 RepID=A0ABY4WDM3_9BACL|nr:helix-turn-helix transcriptional regulator [Brevibacillus ruminantium]USG64037.1 helix-turn-helix transcriptional regulator [Brevibacillus ruminantium]
MFLGQRLKECRKAKKLTQQELSDALSLNRSTYAKYETGDNEPDNQTLQKLADFFDVKIDYLLGRTNDPSPSEKKDKLEKSRDELLQELTDDPDDFFFLDGYLDASDEEKRELRRSFYEIKKQMRENKVKSYKPPSLFDLTEGIEKDKK